MSWKDDYLAYWHLIPGTPEAEEAWEAKMAMEYGPKRKAPMAIVQADVCYDSPIDGRPITNRFARMEDMARANCIEYDPGMKQDYVRRAEESERNLDRSVSETVDRAIAQMPARKREKLEAELQGGLTAEPVRQVVGTSTVAPLRD